MWTLLLTSIIVALTYLYLNGRKKLQFWKNRGVEGPEPNVIYGNLKDSILLKASVGEVLKQMYLDFPKEKMIGFYERTKPMLLLRDPEIIRDVLIKDFSNFANRGAPTYRKVDPLTQHLLFLETEQWRPLRHKLSPVFTTGKLKEMFYILKDCCNHFGEYLERTLGDENSSDARDLALKFTTDVIGSCAFGLEMNSLSDEEGHFRKMGRKIFELDLWKFIKLRIRDFFPWVYEMLWWLFYDYEMNNFFINNVKETMEYRDKENVVRHDFIDILRDIKANPEKLQGMEIDDSLLAAQAFVFFAAGFETSGTTISHALYLLAQYPDLQEKLYQEIMAELKACGGDLKYESIKNMKYMHKVFLETLRLLPPAVTLTREAKNEYTFSGTNVTIPAKQFVWISVYGIHHDPEIYPNPDVFDPERFDEEQVKSRHPMHHLPFGNGPRNCIGARFAVNQVKCGLVEVLKRYRVETYEKTMIPYVSQSTQPFLLAPKDGIWLKFVKRQ